MGDKFAQLKQFWQKGSPAQEAAATPAPRQPVLTTRSAPAAEPGKTVPMEETASAVPASAPPFDPYGDATDFDFVPEEKPEVPLTDEKAEPARPAFNPLAACVTSSADSLYVTHEEFVPEEKEQEQEQEEEEDEGKPTKTEASPYAMSEDFVEEKPKEDKTTVFSPYAGAEDFIGEDASGKEACSPYDVAGQEADIVFNPEETPARPAAGEVKKDLQSRRPAPGYAAASTATIDIYGMTDETEEGSENIHKYSPGDEDERYSVTPYESFQGDSTPYYAGAVDEDLALEKETNASLYGEADEESRPDSAYTDDADCKEDAKHVYVSDDEDSDASDFEYEPTKRRVHKAKDWNSEFQTLLDMPASAEKYNKLARLAHDFVFAAETYGKIIISELSLPVEKKTIKPIDVGGQAGGEKYIVQGIFFKFALDIFNIYGSDECAMKAASHDLKGLIHYYSCQIAGLHVPLMALIDYLGFRLIAITILPINSSTIRYGSCDAGRTVHADDPKLNEMMEQAGTKMKLQSHFVGVPGGIPRKLCAPVDIEGHLGTDNRYYVVDFARTFPPERPSPANMKKKGIVLYNLLRPELVKSNVEPLSSDAFTLWAKADPNKDLYNKRVTDATLRLLKEVIPAVAATLNQLNEKNSHVDIVEVLHSAGVNLRHMGLVRRLVDKPLQATIMIEMIARVVRKGLQEKYRKKTRSAGIPTEEPHKQTAAKYLNKLLGRHYNSGDFWLYMKKALLRKFHKCLLEHELADTYDLRYDIRADHLFERLQKLAPNIFVLTEPARQDFNKACHGLHGEGYRWGERPIDLKFHPSDLMPLASTVKHMNVIDIAEACASFYSSLDEKGNDQSRLLIQGLNKFQIAARKMPFIEVETIIMLGDMLVRRAKEGRADQKSSDVEQALDGAQIAFQTAMNFDTNNSRCMMGLGDIYEAQDKWEEAVAMYEKAIVVQPDLAEAHVKIAKVWSYRSNDEYQEVIESHLRQALKYKPDCVEALVMLADLSLRKVETTLNSKELDESMLEDSQHLFNEVSMLYHRALRLRSATSDDFKSVLSSIRTLNDRCNGEAGSGKSRSTALRMRYQLAELDELFSSLCTSILASLTEAHFEYLSLPDKVFSYLMGSAKAAERVHFLDTTYLTEEPVLRWLQSHPASLTEIEVAECPQFTDRLLEVLVISRHRNTLQKLSLTKNSNLTKDALLRAFKPVNSNTTWPSLTSLDVSDLPSVDDEVMGAISQASTSFTNLSIARTSVTDNAMNVMPGSLTHLHLGGTLSLGSIQTLLTERCTALTHLSLKGVQTIDDVNSFILPTLLPCLKQFQFPNGQTHLWSGNETATLRLLTSHFMTNIIIERPNEPMATYRTTATVNATIILGEAMRLMITGSPTIKTLSHEHFIGKAIVAQTGGSWNFTWSYPGTLIKSIQFNQYSRQFTFMPQHIVKNYQAFSNHQVTITVSPQQNITLLCAVVWIGALGK